MAKILFNIFVETFLYEANFKSFGFCLLTTRFLCIKIIFDALDPFFAKKTQKTYF